MLSPRWRKLERDVKAERGRAGLMVAAIAVSLVAVATVLGAYAILTREITVNYLGTRPASATLELPEGVDAALVSAVRRLPGIAEAEARDVVLARVRVGDDWRPLLLFVIADFADLRLGTFRSESGSWPPPEGSMLVERSAVRMLRTGQGARVVVKTPKGAPRAVPITGLVYDPGLAPAWQERVGYGYVTPATLAALGEAPALHELRVELRSRTKELTEIEAAASRLAAQLIREGHPVHQIRIPPPGQHPHEKQMKALLLLLLAFGAMALFLSAVLAATSLAAMLARQVREIGVMKTLGARTGQLSFMYLALVLSLGLASLAVAIPLGLWSARGFARAVASMLNFTLTSESVPWWVLATVAAAGLLVPLLVAALPVARATRRTVREAIDEHGTGAEKARRLPGWLPVPVRNALRRPVRLGLTMLLLSAAGAMFLTALDVSRGWERNVAKVYETRRYDVEVRLHAPLPDAVAEGLRHLPGVLTVEAWGYSPAAFSRPDTVDVVRTYPDRGHGSLTVLAPTPGTRLIRFPILSGRWLEPGDTDAVVLNHGAASQAPGLRVGNTVTLSLDGRALVFRVVGIVEEIGSSGIAYVTREAFAGAVGTTGADRLLRVATTARSPRERSEVIRAIDADLTGQGVGVEAVLPLVELRTAMGDHIALLVNALVAMALVLATVGALGLGSAMGISVVERTRELGVLKTVGATPGRIVRLLIGEALFIAGASGLLGAALSVPLAAAVCRLVGNLGFLVPLPLVITPAPIVLWLALVLLVAVLATWLPARSAAALPVREALARV